MPTTTEITLEDYIITIYRLEKLERIAKTTLIAKELSVKPATVSKVIENLELKGLAKRVKYKGVTLTEKGRMLARKIIHKHRILEVFLNEYLGFDWIKSHYLAHQLEHIPSIVVEKIFQKFLKDKKRCPHGNPLIDIESEEQTLSLFEGVPGKFYKIVRIKSELRFVLKEITKNKLRLNDVVQLLNKNNLISLRNLRNQEILKLSPETAKALNVVEVEQTEG